MQRLRAAKSYDAEYDADEYYDSKQVEYLNSDDEWELPANPRPSNTSNPSRDRPSNRNRGPAAAKPRRNIDDYSTGDDGDDLDDLDLSKLSPASLRRAKRRIANRQCARRIRQRKANLVTNLSEKVAALQEINTLLHSNLNVMVKYWRDVNAVNCVLKHDLESMKT